MTRPNTVKKHPGGAPGAKILITTASLAITLGGWAAFTRANVETADTASPPPAALALELPRPSTDLKLAPQLLPTIVPAAPPPPQRAIARAPVIPAALLDVGTPAARPHAAAAPAPVAA